MQFDLLMIDIHRKMENQWD